MSITIRYFIISTLAVMVVIYVRYRYHTAKRCPGKEGEFAAAVSEAIARQQLRLSLT